MMRSVLVLSAKALAVLLVLSVAALVLLPGGDGPDPAAAPDWERPVGEDSDEPATALAVYETLAYAGLDEATVTVVDGDVRVDYEQPDPTSDMDAAAAWMAVFEAVALHAPHTDGVTITTYAEGEAVYEVSVATDDVVAMVRQDVTMEEFRGRVDVRAV